MILNLGCGEKTFGNAINVDIKPGKNVDVVCDLESTWPFKKMSIKDIYADNVLEHLPDPLHSMQEIYRVLDIYGTVTIIVPSTNGMGAFQDPTHRSFWNYNSFLYYTDTEAARYVGFKGRFKIKELFEYSIFWKVGGSEKTFIPMVRAVLRKMPWQNM